MESMNQQLLRKKLKQEEELRAHEEQKQRQMEQFEREQQQRRQSKDQDTGSVNFHQIIKEGDLDTLNQVNPSEAPKQVSIRRPMPASVKHGSPNTSSSALEGQYAPQKALGREPAYHFNHDLASTQQSHVRNKSYETTFNASEMAGLAPSSSRHQPERLPAAGIQSYQGLRHK